MTSAFFCTFIRKFYVLFGTVDIAGNLSHFEPDQRTLRVDNRHVFLALSHNTVSSINRIFVSSDCLLSNTVAEFRLIRAKFNEHLRGTSSYSPYKAVHTIGIGYD